MVDDIDITYRDFNSANDPGSGDHEPEKPRIRRLLKNIRAAGGQSITKGTVAALMVATPPNENYMGIALSGDGAGYYYRSVGTWVFGRGFPDTVAELVDIGGTANSVTASVKPGVDPSEVVEFIIEPLLTNDGDVVLTLEGGTPKPVRNINGGELAPGEWTAGRKIMLTEDDTEFRLLSDPDADGAAASAAASSAAAQAALIALSQRYIGTYVDNTAASAAASGVGGTTVGMLYFNTTSSVFRYWDGDSWETIPYATVADGAITAAKLEAALAAQVVPRATSLTINVPGDYTTVLAAIEAASLVRFKAGRIPIINLQAGFLWKEELELQNVDLRGLTIVSEDAVVGLDDSFPKIFPAAVWDGAGTRSRRTAAMDGVADGKKGLVSFWAKFSGGDAAVLPVLVGRSGVDIAFSIRRLSTGIWAIQGRLSPGAGAIVLTILSNSVWNVADGWHHVLASWDLATGQAQLYINDVNDINAGAVVTTNTAIDYTVPDWGFGCEPASAADATLTMNGALAEVYINLAESLDLSVTANRRKFIQATSKAPEVLGWRATRPTGNRPALWFNGVYQSFRVNFGTGGAFVNSGDFVPAPTYPDGTAAGVAASDGAKIARFENCLNLTWDILVDGNGHAFQGFDLYRMFGMKIGEGGGIKNCLEDNMEANKGSYVQARFAIFSGAGYRGIQADGGSSVDCIGVNVNECFWGLNGQNGSLLDGSPEGSSDTPVVAVSCYDRAIIVDEQTRANMWLADFRDCAGTHAVEVVSGATVYLQGATTRAAAVGVPNLLDCKINGATATGWGYQVGSSGALLNV